MTYGTPHVTQGDEVLEISLLESVGDKPMASQALTEEAALLGSDPPKKLRQSPHALPATQKRPKSKGAVTLGWTTVHPPDVWQQPTQLSPGFKPPSLVSGPPLL